MRSAFAFRAPTVLLLAACNPAVYACTEIGCDDALVVRFDRVPAGAYRAEAIAAGAPPAVFECAAGENCPSAYFPGLVAEAVTVRVTTSAGTRMQAFTGLRYEAQYPNGRRCGAACRQAIVTVQL